MLKMLEVDFAAVVIGQQCLRSDLTIICAAIGKHEVVDRSNYAPLGADSILGYEATADHSIHKRCFNIRNISLSRGKHTKLQFGLCHSP